MEQITQFTYPVVEFVNLLNHAHNDNQRLRYFAADASERLKNPKTIMPVTPFVFEFFIYNSLYQIDWDATLKAGSLQHYNRELSESKQQCGMEKFLKPYIKRDPTCLKEAFAPIRTLSLDGDWTAVVPDSRISTHDGEKFFSRMRKLQEAIFGAESLSANLTINSALLDDINQCRYHLYLVRNNIFHGSKTLGETYEQNQRQRLEVYLALLRSITGLFFIVVRRQLSHSSIF